MFIVWLPFRLSPGKEIKLGEEPFIANILGSEVKLRRLDPYFILTASGMRSESEAEAMLKKLGSGLLWAALENVLGLKLSVSIQQPHIVEDPVRAAENMRLDSPVDAFIDADKAAIYPSDKRVRPISVGEPSLTLHLSPEQFLQSIATGAALDAAATLIDQPKLTLGIELYCISHFEATPSARFLMLCTALEALAPAPTLAPEAVELVERWRAEAVAAANATPERQTQDELRSLADRLRFLRQKSHNRRIKDFIHDIFSGDPTTAAAMAREMSQLYDRRSRLVHEGTMDLGNGPNRLDHLMRTLLQAAMQQAPSQA